MNYANSKLLSFPPKTKICFGLSLLGCFAYLFKCIFHFGYFYQYIVSVPIMLPRMFVKIGIFLQDTTSLGQMQKISHLVFEFFQSISSLLRVQLRSPDNKLKLCAALGMRCFRIIGQNSSLLVSFLISHSNNIMIALSSIIFLSNT